MLRYFIHYISDCRNIQFDCHLVLQNVEQIKLKLEKYVDNGLNGKYILQKLDLQKFMHDLNNNDNKQKIGHLDSLINSLNCMARNRITKYIDDDSQVNQNKVQNVTKNQIKSVLGDIECVEKENIDELDFQVKATQQNISKTQQNMEQLKIEIQKQEEQIRNSVGQLIDKVYQG